MNAGNVSLWIIYATPISTLIMAVAGCIAAIASWITSQANHRAIAEVAVKVDGQLTKSRDDAAAAVKELNVLQGRIDSGEFDNLSEEEKREKIRVAKIDAAKLLEVAVLAASELRRRTAEIEAKLGPEKVKAAALDAVHAAVKHEIERTP